MLKSIFGTKRVPVPNSPYGLLGRKATMNLTSVIIQTVSERRSYVRVEVAVLDSLSLIWSLWTESDIEEQRSGAV